MAEFEHSYYLDKAGLALVMNEKGVNSLYCLDIFGTDVFVEDGEACSTLFSMVGEDVITMDDDDRFIINEPFNRMCQVMAEAQRILAVYSNGRKNVSTVFYLTDGKATGIQSAPNRQNVLKVFEADRGNIIDYIKETVDTKFGRDYKVKEKQLFLESLEFLSLEDNFEQIIENPDTLLFLELVSPDGKRGILKTAFIGSGKELKMCVWNDDGFKIDTYNGERFEKLVSEI